MCKRAFAAGLAVFLFFSAASAQKAEITISLNEAFFDALLDSVFQNFDPLELSIAQTEIKGGSETQSKSGIDFRNPSFSISESSAPRRFGGKRDVCKASVRILREMNGIRTAVRFREGKIFVPLAFSGNYAPPFVGCVELAGWAETNIDLEFDQANQRLVGRAKVLRVNLNGAGGLGGSVIARLIQNSVDKKLNPIEIIRLDKLSFGVPIQNAGSIRMKAASVRSEIASGALNILITYQFLKS